MTEKPNFFRSEAKEDLQTAIVRIERALLMLGLESEATIGEDSFRAEFREMASEQLKAAKRRLEASRHPERETLLSQRAQPSAIYLDQDGVLVDFVGHALRLFDIGVDAVPEVDGWDRIPNVLSERLGRTVSGNELWGKIADAGSEFWATIPWTEWGRELVSICEAAAPVVIMTTPSGPSSAHGKIEWIAKEMPEVWGKRYALTTCKHHMAHPGALLIDDGQHNIDAFLEHGGEAFLWPAPWNSKRQEALDDPGCIRALAELRERLC